MYICGEENYFKNSQIKKKEFTLALQTFDLVFTCKIRLLHCKVLSYCIWKGFEPILMFRSYSDSLVFLLIHLLSTKVEPA